MGARHPTLESQPVALELGSGESVVLAAGLAACLMAASLLLGRLATRQPTIIRLNASVMKQT
jgi:hypothetical protein